MKFVLPISITNAMVSASTVASPDTTIGETAWSSTEIVAASAERIVAAPSSTVTLTIASPCVVTWAANGLAVDTEVVPATDGALPTGLTAGTTYYVAARLSADTFTLKDADGRTINTSGSQSGTHTLTAKVHKVYQAAYGSAATVTGVDTGTDRLTVTAHGFTGTQTLAFSSTGTLPSPLVQGTLYQFESISSANQFKLKPYGGGADIDITTSGSGTITVHYGTATIEPNINKPPAINSTYWTEVSPTNRWAMIDGAVAETTDTTSPLRVSLVPGEAFDTVAMVGLSGASAATVRHEINRATVTADAGTDKITHTAHGMAADTPVSFTTTGTLPSPLAAYTTYYVKAPGTNDYQLSATVGGAAINLTDAGTGTHTAGQVAYEGSLDVSAPIPYATGIVSTANQSVAAYQNGTLTVTVTGSGTISCREMVVGLSTDAGTTVEDLSNGIRNYSVITRDDFGNVTTTSRGYTKTLRASVLVPAADVNTVSRFLSENKDATLLIIATDAFEVNSLYGLVTDWEMSSNSDNYKLLRIEAEGLLATT